MKPLSSPLPCKNAGTFFVSWFHSRLIWDILEGIIFFGHFNFFALVITKPSTLLFGLNDYGSFAKITSLVMFKLGRKAKTVKCSQNIRLYINKTTSTFFFISVTLNCGWVLMVCCTLYLLSKLNAKVGKVPIVRSSDLDPNLLTSDYDLFMRF